MATQLSATFAPAATTTATPLPAPQQQLRHGRRCYRALSLRPPRAASGDDGAGGEVEPTAPAAPAKTATATDGGGDDFEERVLRIKSRVGPKKRGSAAARKRKGGAGASSKSKAAVTLPPVPLREARSSVGVPVEFGFSAYSERLNGALAAVGLAALLLVELGSGKALVKYHQPATLFLQVYTVAAAGAVFVKYEKERISVWPGPPATKPPATGE
uniref:Immunophilin-like n=1 Tax=Oryza rufipogon TaxID=4529 RepID=A0A0E0PY10_ORYRU